MGFKPATKEKSKLRLALIGPSGSGKTFTALTLAQHLGKRVAVIDSERGSASKYADLFTFDTSDLENHGPQTYINEIKEAEKAGYDVLIIDSLTHAWSGKDGALEMIDKINTRNDASTKRGNSFTAWREVTPQHNALVDAILQSKCHVIATMRVKQEYVIEENEKGKKVPRKIGLAPVQRDGVEYEFDVIADMNLDHDLIVSKTRCHAVDGYIQRKPGKEFAETLKGWLDAGVAPKNGAESNGASPASKDNTDNTNPKSEGSKPAPATAANKTAAKKEVVPAPASATSSPDPVQSGDEPLPTAAQRAAERAATVTDSPKSAAAADTVGQTASAAATAASPGEQSDSKTSVNAQPQKVTADQIGQLLQAATANGWTRKQAAAFVCHAWNHEPATFAQTFTVKQWESAVKILGRPENKGGKVVVDGNGKQLPADKQWSQVA